VKFRPDRKKIIKKIRKKSNGAVRPGNLTETTNLWSKCKPGLLFKKTKQTR
jgi:hypothetical protein